MKILYSTVDIWADLNCNNETKLQWCGLGYKHFWGGGHYLGRGGEMEQQLNVMSSPLVLSSSI